MAKAFISPLAQSGMTEIADYIEIQLQNPASAHKLIRRFRDLIMSLEAFPEMGASLLILAISEGPYRYLLCGNYMIFYHISEASVLIDRVLYGRRDYISLLFPMKQKNKNSISTAFLQLISSACRSGSSLRELF